MAELTKTPDGDVQYFHKHWRGTVTAGNNTGIIYINDPPPISLSLSPGSGVTAAYWEYTITPREVIADNAANAVWHKWPIGDVAFAAGAKADAILGPVTAVRGTTAGGSTVFCVVAHNGNV